MKSIIQNKKECYMCKTTYSLEEHHIFFGKANRKLSEEDGMKVYLCYEHHRGTFGVHGKNGKQVNIFLKQKAEQTWLAQDKSRTIEDFIKRYGKNYL